MSKLTKSANGKACVRCSTRDGTVCARHYNGLRQHRYGKGRGKKCHDVVSAELCNQCDQLFSEGVNYSGDGERAGKSINRSESFLHYVTLTNIARFNRGDLKA